VPKSNTQIDNARSSPTINVAVSDATNNARSSPTINMAVSDGVSSTTVSVTSVNPVIKSLFDKNVRTENNHSVTSSDSGEEKTFTTENKSQGDDKKTKKYAKLISVNKTKD